MRKTLTLALILGFLLPCTAQAQRITTSRAGFKEVTRTVSQLPACTAGRSGWFFTVTDGASATDCSTGGGSDVQTCYCDGTAWTAISTGAAGGAWTDGGAGGPVYVTTSSTDDVVVGGAAAIGGALLTVDGNEDEVQVLVQGHTTQTNPMFVVEWNDGYDLMSVGGGASGDAQITWNVYGLGGSPQVQMTGDATDSFTLTEIDLRVDGDSVAPMFLVNHASDGIAVGSTVIDGLFHIDNDTKTTIQILSLTNDAADTGDFLEMSDGTNTTLVDFKANGGGWYTPQATGTPVRITANTAQTADLIMVQTFGGDELFVVDPDSVDIGEAASGTNVPLNFHGSTSGTVSIQPAAAAGTYTLTLPTTDGNASEFLQTDGAGVLTWAAAGGSVWTDSGTNIYPTTTTDDVVIGGTAAVVEVLSTSAAKFSIDGDADQVQFVVEANATQSAGPIMAIQSPSVTYIHVGTSGDLEINPNAGSNGFISYNDVQDTILATRDITSGGRVDIGTAADLTGMLNVNNQDLNNPAMVIRADAGQVGNMVVIEDSSGTDQVVVEADYDLALKAGNALTFDGSTSGTVTIVPAAAAGTYTLTLPTTDGTASQFLQTDGAGVLTWATSSGTDSNAVKEIYFAAESLTDLETNYCNLVEEDLAAYDIWVRACDDTTQEYMGGKFKVPSDLSGTGSDNVTFRVVCYAATAATAGAAFDFNHTPRANGEPASAATSTVASGTITLDTTQDDLNIHTWTETITNLGWVAGDTVFFTLARDPADAGDTLTGDLYVVDFTIMIPRE